MMRALSNPVVHLELHTPDLARARDFYAGLCAWRPELIGCEHGTYLTLQIGGGLGGGIVECAAGRPLWLPYVEVADVAEATARARELRASVLMEPREGPSGWRSVVAAPASGELALWQRKREIGPDE